MVPHSRLDIHRMSIGWRILPVWDKHPDSAVIVGATSPVVSVCQSGGAGTGNAAREAKLAIRHPPVVQVGRAVAVCMVVHGMSRVG